MLMSFLEPLDVFISEILPSRLLFECMQIFLLDRDVQSAMTLLKNNGHAKCSDG